MSRPMSRTARAILLSVGVAAGLHLAGTSAFAQRFAPQEVDRPNMTCSQLAQNCMRQQGQNTCEGLKQECIRTGTWQGARETSRNVQKR